MEKKIETFTRIIDLFSVSGDGVKLSFVKTLDGREYIKNQYEKYFKITQIRKATPRENDDKAIDIIFDGYFDEEAIARDKNKVEEDALVERVTKAVLEKLEERDKKVINIKNPELSDEVIEQANKLVEDAVQEYRESIIRQLNY